MSAYRKNILVGLTVIVALIILGWMVLLFGGTAAGLFVQPQIGVHLIAERADGVSDGSAVQFRGVVVGRVTQTSLADNDRGVVIDVLLNRDPPLPGNVTGIIRPVGLVGGMASVSLEPSAAATSATLQPGQNIPTKYAGSGLLPPEFAELAKEMKETTQQIRTSGLVENINLVVKKTTEVVNSMQKLIGDDKLQADLKQSVADLREMMATARKTTGNIEKFSQGLPDVSANVNATLKNAQGRIDDLSRQMGDRLLQIGRMLESVQSITDKINEGKGTAGKLLNDSRLYEGLVDTSKDLNVAIKDLKRLVEQWEQEGVSLKLR